MISPFEHLQIDRDLVCEFFGWFARFEYTLKETGFCKAGRNGNAEPNWRCLGEKIGRDLADCKDQNVVGAIQYLVNDPPQVQKCVGRRPEFREDRLQGENHGEKAIEAVRRVRNNLFHGGKHTPHSPPGRDEKLIFCSLIILEACLNLREDLRSEFEAPTP
jgi:hypothetical protein